MSAEGTIVELKDVIRQILIEQVKEYLSGADLENEIVEHADWDVVAEKLSNRPAFLEGLAESVDLREQAEKVLQEEVKEIGCGKYIDLEQLGRDVKEKICELDLRQMILENVDMYDPIRDTLAQMNLAGEVLDLLLHKLEESKSARERVLEASNLRLELCQIIDQKLVLFQETAGRSIRSQVDDLRAELQWQNRGWWQRIKDWMGGS